MNPTTIDSAWPNASRRQYHSLAYGYKLSNMLNLLPIVIILYSDKGGSTARRVDNKPFVSLHLFVQLTYNNIVMMACMPTAGVP